MIPTSANPRTYLYNAHAIGVGGRITRPFDEPIDAQAATALPISGGQGTACVENFHFRKVVSFKSAHAQVSGSQSSADYSYATLAMATVEGFNVQNMVIAKRLVSRLASHYPANDQQQPTIVPVGSHLAGFHVAGCELEVELDIDTFSKLDKAHAYDQAQKTPGAYVSKGIVVTSLVKNIVKKSPCSGITISPGGVIDVPHFGRIYVAQFLLSPYAWRLIMLRVELGCPLEGSVTAGETQGNGTTVP